MMKKYLVYKNKITPIGWLILKYGKESDKFEKNNKNNKRNIKV
jgi:hypothetical protein